MMMYSHYLATTVFETLLKYLTFVSLSLIGGGCAFLVLVFGFRFSVFGFCARIDPLLSMLRRNYGH